MGTLITWSISNFWYLKFAEDSEWFTPLPTDWGCAASVIPFQLWQNFKANPPQEKIIYNLAWANLYCISYYLNPKPHCKTSFRILPNITPNQSGFSSEFFYSAFDVQKLFSTWFMPAFKSTCTLAVGDAGPGCLEYRLHWAQKGFGGASASVAERCSPPVRVWCFIR